MIQKYNFLQISSELYRKLNSLNFRNTGYLQRVMKECRQRNIESYVYVIQENNIILAYVLLYIHENLPHAMTYVRRDCRGKGYGSKLIKKIAEDYDVIYVFKHDKPSIEFYNKFSILIKIQNGFQFSFYGVY